MKSVFGFLLILLASPSIAAPSMLAARTTAQPTHIERVGFPMKWTGNIRPGGEITTLYGQAHAIYDQILLANPLYNADDFPTAGIMMGATSEVKLAKRDQITCYSDYSGKDHGGNDNAITTSYQILQLMGGFCHVGANSCTRLECTRYSSIGGGIWACNNNATDAKVVECKRFGDLASYILDSCTPVVYDAPTGIKYNLHEGMYSTEDDYDIHVQRC